ncbi:MAG: hypothetical protein R6X29_04400 [Acidimicrobiia bacterium]
MDDRPLQSRFHRRRRRLPWGIIRVVIGLFLDIALHAGSATMTRSRSSA